MVKSVFSVQGHDEMESAKWRWTKIFWYGCYDERRKCRMDE